MNYTDRQKLKPVLMLAKEKLQDDEFIILARRYGLDDKDPWSVTELANLFRKNKEEIRKISRIAFFKLREFTEDKPWFDNMIGEYFRPRRI